MTEEIKLPANIKKMEMALKQMEVILQAQKSSLQQTEKEFQNFKRFATSFIEHSKMSYEKKPRKPSGFVLPVSISPELSQFLNIPEGQQVARTEVTRFLIQYIQEHDLSHPEKKTLIIPNDALAKLLGPDVELDTLTRFTIQKYMNRHFLTT